MNLLIKPVWVIIENHVQDVIGHEAYGTYASLFSLVLIFSVLADWGINNYSTKEIAQDTSKYNSIFNTLFIVRIAILVIYPLFMMGVGYFLKYEEAELKLLGVIALTQTFVYFLMFFRAKFQAFQSFKADGFMSVIERVLLIIIILSFDKVMDLELFINARLVAILIAVIISFTLVTRLYGWVKLKFSKSEITQTLKEAFPFTMMTLLYSINERVDMVMVERMVSNHEAGIYAGAYRFYDAFMMFAWLVMPIFFSKFAKVNSEKKGASDLLNQGFLLISIPMLLITPFLFFDGKLLFFMFGNSTELEIFNMNRLFQLLMISFICNAFFVVKGTFLNASGYVKKVNIIIGISVVLNVVLNYFFIPTYGALAAAAATAISTGFLGLGYFVLVMLSRLRIDLINLVGVFTAFVFSFGFYFIIKQNVGELWLCILGSIVVFYLVIHFFGIVDKIKNNV